ncbi:MAG: hypothetical protein IKP29_02950 [Pseudobutyrivibrio sp.]|nr:hypothetical protein [Pseudobutyrivibrio sp.]
MKTSNYLIALAALTSFTFVSCSDNDFLGSDNGPSTAQGNGEISFATTGPAKLTRAGEILGGSEAAKKLDNHFVVYGWKSDDEAATNKEVVFPNYYVEYIAGTAHTTESNTHDWEYVGYESVPLTGEALNQTIKYWDYAKNRYDFLAWSIKNGSTSKLTEITTSGTGQWKKHGLTFYAPTADEAANIYISNQETVKHRTAKPGSPVGVADNNQYGGYVTLKFRNLAAKVRMAIYETVPGYSIKDIVFYQDDAGTSPAKAADQSWIYNVGEAAIPSGDATINVKYAASADAQTAASIAAENQIPENQAVVDISPIAKANSITFGELKGDKAAEYKEGTTPTWLGRASNAPTYAKGRFDGVNLTAEQGKEVNYYTNVFPKAAGELNLKVDYTLQSIDGSGDNILVTGAKAIIPSSFCEWKSNYAYTYLFKISDNTNGSSGTPGTDPAGLYPITFDAVVVDMVEDNAQETITELANASVTTYQFGTVVTENDEYVQKDAPNAAANTPAYIYVTASLMNDDKIASPKTGLATLTKGTAAENTYKAELFIVNNLGTEPTTEETVANYVNNKIILTDITNLLTITSSIPLEQTMDKVKKDFATNQIAYFAATEGYTYAVRFTDNSATPKQIYKIIKVVGDRPEFKGDPDPIVYPYTLTVVPQTINEGSTVANVVTITENYTPHHGSGANYNVYGAADALYANGFTFSGTAASNAYSATANQNENTATGIVVSLKSTSDELAKDATNKLAIDAYNFAGDAVQTVTPGATNSVELKLADGHDAAASATNFTITALSNAATTGITKGSYTGSSGLLALNVVTTTKGGSLYNIVYNNEEKTVASKNLRVAEWSIALNDAKVKYVNTATGFISTTEINVAKDGVATPIVGAANTFTATGCTMSGSNPYTLTPAADAPKVSVAYMNSNKIDLIVTKFSWKIYSTLDAAKAGTGSEADGITKDTENDQVFYVRALNNGELSALSTFSATGAQISTTSETGVYRLTIPKNTASVTISLNYKGITDYITKSVY